MNKNYGTLEARVIWECKHCNSPQITDIEIYDLFEQPKYKGHDTGYGIDVTCTDCGKFSFLDVI